MAMELTRRPAVLGLALAAALAATPAGADTVLLTDGTLVTGEVQSTDLALTTREGTSRLGVTDLDGVLLNRLGGDVVRSRTGAAVIGTVEQPTFAVRLPYGQTVVFPRTHVYEITFRRR
jgi:hypothetical protein